jgi:TolB-like protein/tetratricopeptide (TPR) repeat protein
MALPLLAELNRRRVFRALVVYGVVAFAVLQVIEPIMHGMHWPDSVLSYVVVGLALGFPVVVALAWAFDVSTSGIEWHGPAAGSHVGGVRLYLVLGVIGLLAAAPGFAWYFLRRLPGESAKAPGIAPSVAVLAFADMSAQHDQEYFADGVAEEILSVLARIEGVRVPGRTSSFYFKGKTVKLADIGRELGVGNVLQGSVRKDGNRIRVTAQLVRIDDEKHLWSETYDRELSGIFGVQDDIAKGVVEAMKLKLLAGDSTPGHQPKQDAYDEYLLGRHVWLTNPSRKTAQRALQHFQRAAAADPLFGAPRAYVSILSTRFGLGTEADRFTLADQQKAMAEAEKAISLAPDEAVGYEARAYVEWSLWDWAAAKRDFERSLTLNKTNADPQSIYAAFLQIVMGRTGDAIKIARGTTERDPLNMVNWYSLGLRYLYADDLAPARRALNRSLELSPDNSLGTYSLGIVELLSGSPAEGLALFERHPEERGRLVGIAVANHDLGRSGESQHALDDLIAKHGSGWPYSIAQVHAWRGEPDLAFDWLDRAYRQRVPGLSGVKVDPLLRKIRGDPRFGDLLRRMNFPD